jgi:hypothetical protein
LTVRGWRFDRVLLIPLAVGAAALGSGDVPHALGRGDAGPATPAVGPLTVSKANPRYFADPHGRLVYLTGAHTWNSLQDRGPLSPPPQFDYESYLKFLRTHNHNFMRMWAWESARWAPDGKPTGGYFVAPLPYLRTGPGRARDGQPKYDLTKFNPEYFERLRTRVAAARSAGVYVSVMLFQGFSVERKGRPGSPWAWHPYHADNNINGVDGDTDADGEGEEAHSLQNRRVVAFQEAYVRKVVDTLHDQDNVLWEISNESNKESDTWQYHFIDVLRRYEATKKKRHPIGMTANRVDTNANLFASAADWISPTAIGGYMEAPPAATGAKVIISDTDHLWGMGGDGAWVWKSFVRGLNPVYMDDLGKDSATTTKQDARRAMGDTLTYATRMSLLGMTPRADLASSTFCLAAPGVEYLVYVPEKPHWLASWLRSPRGLGRLSAVRRLSSWIGRWQRPSVTVDLSAAAGTLAVEWFDPAVSTVIGRQETAGGAVRSFVAPVASSRGDVVLYIAARR